jgi:hypothetical protein
MAVVRRIAIDKAASGGRNRRIAARLRLGRVRHFHIPAKHPEDKYGLLTGIQFEAKRP